MGPGQILATIFGIIISIPTLIGVASILYSQYYVIRNNNTMIERLLSKKLKSVAASQNSIHWKFSFPYDNGHFNNFVTVFGTKPWAWLLPIAIDNKKEHDITLWKINDRYMLPTELLNNVV